MDANAGLAFETSEQLEQWLKANHDSQRELWVRMYKKGSGTPSVDWTDCVIVCIAWGWIDGQHKSLDEVSFLQRITPRRRGRETVLRHPGPAQLFAIYYRIHTAKRAETKQKRIADIIAMLALGQAFH